MSGAAVTTPAVVALILMVAGVGLTVGALVNAFGDYAALCRFGVNGARRLIAWQGIRHQASRLIALAVLIAAVRWTGQPDVPWVRELIHGRNTFSLAVALLITIDVAWDYLDVRRLRRKAEGALRKVPGGR